ncbi:CU044_2847 family protein [Actinomadura roseirufa]|uniref:CU044_2847 family protein n=1 Tax=Actinomadura roseirufa TaxID=2094049 RepID=UPI00104107EB|nr:CU044_2847 family protein [Actinomadura roseirufa]
MNELVRWTTEHGTVVVESDDREPGMDSVSVGDGIVREAGVRFEEALLGVREAAEAALGMLRGGALAPDALEMEFGVKLNAAAGAVIAKTSLEGHLKVKMTWGTAGAPAEEE